MTLPHQLQSLEGLGLIRLAALRPELEYLFRHALMQEAIYHTLVKQDRKRLHRAVGHILEQTDPERAGELAAVLARHFAEAGDEPRALRYHSLAGAYAAQRYANAEAVMHYARALELAAADLAVPVAQLVDLYTRLGRSLELMGNYAAALANYEAMRADALRRGDRALELAALVLLAQTRSTPNPGFDAAAGVALSAQALALARELGDRHAEAKILWIQVNLFMFADRLDESIQVAEPALRLARELGLREQLAYTLNDVWRVHITRGEAERALKSVQEASRLWGELRNVPMLTDSLASTAVSLFFDGRYDDALRTAAEGLQLSRSIHNRWGESYNQFAVGYIYWERGEPARAIDSMEACVRISVEAGFTTPQMHTRADLGWLYGSLGDLPRGIALARLAAQSAAALLPTFRAHALGRLIMLHLLSGAHAEAESALREVQADFAHLNPLVKPAAWLATVAFHLAARDYDQALRDADEFIAYIDFMHFAYVRADAFYLKGCALLETNRPDEARAAFGEAEAAAESFGSRRMLWQILMGRSALAAQSGQPAEATGLRRRARAIILGIASRAPDGLRESFLALPAVAAAFVP